MSQRNDFSPAAVILAAGLAMMAIIWACSGARSDGVTIPQVEVCFTEADVVAMMAPMVPAFDLKGADLDQFHKNYTAASGNQAPDDDHVAVYDGNPKNPDDNVLIVSMKAGCLQRAFVVPKKQFMVVFHPGEPI